MQEMRQKKIFFLIYSASSEHVTLLLKRDSVDLAVIRVFGLARLRMGEMYEKLKEWAMYVYWKAIRVDESYQVAFVLKPIWDNMSQQNTIRRRKFQNFIHFVFLTYVFDKCKNLWSWRRQLQALQEQAPCN